MQSSSLNSQHLGALFEVLPEIHPLQLSVAKSQLLSVDCLRLDKIHPFVSGNKWYKLKHHLSDAFKAGKSQLLSFGGAHSNHLHALAFTGQKLGIKTIGFVRGERPAKLSPTLEDCEKWGMEVRWIARDVYRALASKASSEDFIDEFPEAWVIPEGGAGRHGILGVEALFNSLSHAGMLDYDLIVCPVGSGATLAGIAQANIGRAQCLGFSALKGAYDLEQRVERQLLGASKVNPWRICHNYHFGGFAKINQRLTDFISDTYEQHGLLMDPIYTGKMLFGVAEYVLQGRIQPGAKVLVVHTGGLQGWRGFGDHPLCQDGQYLFSVN